MTTPECTCPPARFDGYGNIEDLPQGTNPDCNHCHPNPLRATWGQQCPTERPFGPCTQRCEHPAGHDGQHKTSCFTWCDEHDISTDVANLWSGPKDLWNTADGGQIIGQMVTRYCRNCPWMEEHMCAFGEDGDCDHTEGWAEK